MPCEYYEDSFTNLDTEIEIVGILYVPDLIILGVLKIDDALLSISHEYPSMLLMSGQWS